MDAVYAVDGIDFSKPDVFSPAGAFDSFGSLVSIIVKNAFVIGGILTFLLLVFGGLTYIMGAGNSDPKRMEQGQKTVVSAVSGLILIIGSYWILQILGLITGVDIIRKLMP
ncbi:hypothetical protein A2Z33_07615 [Candidatus Gottesmanbacteria bacterium RBG_16_52_11]|uniref:Uncharacterized protein n=1 Tax=Candidatus Gottesmanbacteria bacterium RBG_16_52_11 TaxID=1798374 RepID=A0A1F5YNC1_9BACT|nr:MAG: hypothetical protein A2Z33_07615 [Candidatus Gottesmanbacteria bacterium RBG_16_52_11]